MRALRGDRIAIIFQEPLTSLNPLHSIEKQIAEVLLVHKRMSAARRASGSSSCCTWSAWARPRTGSAICRTRSPAASSSG